MKKLGFDEMYFLEDYKNAYWFRLRQCAAALLREQLVSGKQSAKTLELAQELEYLIESAPFLKNNASYYLYEAAIKERREIEKKLIPLVIARKEESSEWKVLQARLESLLALSPDYAATPSNSNWIDYSLFYAWKGRAHEVAYRLLEAQENAPEKVDDLANDLERFAKLSHIPPQSFLEWAKIRRDAGLSMLTVDMY